MYRPRKHTILPHYDPALLTKVDFIFAFVRHPESYYKSVWRFTRRAVNVRPEEMKEWAFRRGNPSAINEAVNRWKPDFDEWIEELLENEPCWMTRWFERYLGPYRGEFCHFIGRTKTLEQDVEKVMELLEYGEQWGDAQPEIAKIVMAKNSVHLYQAPLIKWKPDLLERMLRNERVLLRRFYGEETKWKRIYRNMTTGEPV